MKTPSLIHTLAKASVLVVAVFACLWAATVQAEEERIRTFTDAEGRTIRATLLSATTTSVRVKMASGKEAKIALTKLSKVDQEYIDKWRQLNPNLDLQYTAKKRKARSKRTEVKGIRGSREMWVYDVTLTNRGPSELSDVELRYAVAVSYKNRALKREGNARVVEGKKKIEKLESKKSISFSTTEVAVEEQKGRRKTETDFVETFDYRESLEGILIKAYIKEQLVDTFKLGKIQLDEK